MRTGIPVGGQWRASVDRESSFHCAGLSSTACCNNMLLRFFPRADTHTQALNVTYCTAWVNDRWHRHIAWRCWLHMGSGGCRCEDDAIYSGGFYMFPHHAAVMAVFHIDPSFLCSCMMWTITSIWTATFQTFQLLYFRHHKRFPRRFRPPVTSIRKGPDYHAWSTGYWEIRVSY